MDGPEMVECVGGPLDGQLRGLQGKVLIHPVEDMTSPRGYKEEKYYPVFNRITREYKWYYEHEQVPC